MLTQLESARKGILTDQMKRVAQEEGMDAERLRSGIAEGKIILLCNTRHGNVEPIAIGEGVRTKVNANIGTSRDSADLESEKEKALRSWKAGADTLMDLSTGGDIDLIRKEIMKATPLPIGTVPFYQAAIETVAKGERMVDMEADSLFEVIEKHVLDGVDFLTVHCGVTLLSKERLEAEGRLMDVVSRGGSFLLEWMVYNERENPLFEHYDTLLTIAKKYDLTLS
ncbi:MAG: phosphomethylpyrimidine synthase ThiC, partial [Thermodesulfobacteriota bacterium]